MRSTPLRWPGDWTGLRSGVTISEDSSEDVQLQSPNQTSTAYLFNLMGVGLRLVVIGEGEVVKKCNHLIISVADQAKHFSTLSEALMVHHQGNM